MTLDEAKKEYEKAQLHREKLLQQLNSVGQVMLRLEGAITILQDQQTQKEAKLPSGTSVEEAIKKEAKRRGKSK